MTTLEHSRYKIFSKYQHPYNHRLSEFLYSNDSAPDILNLEDALNFIFGVLYPQTKGVLDTYGELPLVGNSVGDFYTVTSDNLPLAPDPLANDNPSWKDDLDHSKGVWTAGYIWHKYDGDIDFTWHKQVVYDWAEDDVVSELIARTANTYVHKKGLDDVNEEGVLIETPLVDPNIQDLSGQSIFGGASADTNLTLNANNGDDPAVHTGWIQLNDNVRPTETDTFELGNSDNRFKELWTVVANIGSGTLRITSDALGATIKGLGSVINNDFLVDFGFSLIKTTGDIEAGKAVIDNITVDGATILSDTGDIDFGANNLNTTATVNAGEVDTLFLRVGDTEVDNGVMTDIVNDQFVFDLNKVVVNNEIESAFATVTDGVNKLTTDKDSIVTDSDTLVIDSAIDIELHSPLYAQDVDANNIVAGSIVVDEITINNNSIVTDADIDLVLDASGIGEIKTLGNLIPEPYVAGLPVTTIGAAGKLFKDLFLSDTITKDGITAIQVDELLKLREASSGAITGDCLFFDSLTNTWKPSKPDAEIDHSTLSNLTNTLDPATIPEDVGHTQFVMLNGRTGGQDVIGGPLSADTLSLRGYAGSAYWILSGISISPSVSGSLSIGDELTGKAIGDIFGSGQIKGMRIHNIAPIIDPLNAPTADPTRKGRLFWDTDNTGLYADTGTAIARVGLRSFKATYDETTVEGTHDVSATIEHAMNAIWQLKDSTGEILGVKITVTDTALAQEVNILPEIALPAGSYTLVGVEA